jgi:hypothetical protein
LSAQVHLTTLYGKNHNHIIQLLLLNYSANNKRTKTLHAILKALLCLVIFNSCAFEDTLDPTFLVDLNTDIRIGVYQNLYQDNPQNNFIWKVSLNDVDVCEKSQLLTSYLPHDDQDRLYIDGLDNPTDCQEGHYEIFSTHEFGLEGEKKDVVVYLANIENKIQLVDRGDYLSIEHGSLEGLKVSSDHLLTVNNKHLWGGVYTSTEQEQFLFFNLFQQISEEVLYTPISDGNYGYFIKGETTEVIHPQNFRQTTLGFALKVQENFDLESTNVQEFISNFRMQHPEVDFFIADGKGKLF